MCLYVTELCMCLYVNYKKRKTKTLISEEVSAVVFTVEPLLIILNYQYRHTYNGSETTSDGSLELLQIAFSIVVIFFNSSA
jgi:hypothetical protein